MCQKIGYVFLTVNCRDFGLGLAWMGLKALSYKAVAHPGKAGTGLWSYRLEPAGFSLPHEGNDPSREFRSGRKETGVVEVRCDVA